MRTSALLIVLAGCSIPPRNPFDCVGVAPPGQGTQVPANILVHGTVLDGFNGKRPLSNATESEFYIIGSPGTALGPMLSDTTDSAGSFHWTEPMEIVAHKQLIWSQKGGYADAYFYPALPVASDLYVQFAQFTVGDFMSLASLSSMLGLPLDSLDAPLIVSAVDCNDDAVAGATVTVTQASNDKVQVIYFDGDMPNPSLQETALPLGAALVAGLVEGPATVSATFGSTKYIPNDVKVTQGAVTFTEVSP
jgi:hypothetical protein